MLLRLWQPCLVHCFYYYFNTVNLCVYIYIHIYMHRKQLVLQIFKSPTSEGANSFPQNSDITTSKLPLLQKDRNARLDLPNQEPLSRRHLLDTERPIPHPKSGKPHPSTPWSPLGRQLLARSPPFQGTHPMSQRSHLRAQYWTEFHP